MRKESSKELTKQYFNSTAEDYDHSHDGKFVYCMYQRIVERAAALKPDSVLDLGCGNGNVIHLLKSRISAKYYGLDISEKMIEEAKKRFGNEVELCVGDAENLPYEDHTFDLIICNASFHHYTRAEKAVAEMKRVIKPDGTVILGDPTLPGKIFTNMLNCLMKYSHSGEAKIWHKKEIIPLFQRYGFQIKDWKKINYKTFMFSATPET